jgi:hypothetical protein
MSEEAPPDHPKLEPITNPPMGQEIGILVGFIALFILTLIAFSVFWVAKNRVQAKKEFERSEKLKADGWGLKGWTGSEKVAEKRGATGRDWSGKTGGAGQAEHVEGLARVVEEERACGTSKA